MRSDLPTWLAQADFRRILEAVSQSPRTLSTLITLTYSNDPLLRWRTIDAIGRCAESLSGTRPKVLRNYLRRLFWMMSDESGAIVPHAPEVIGEIVRSNTKEFIDFIPLTISLLNLEPEDLPVFLPGILYALGRIGETAQDTMADTVDKIENALAAEDSQARAMAVWCLGRIGCRDILAAHPQLGKDWGPALVYRKEKLLETTVARLYTEAMTGISHE